MSRMDGLPDVTNTSKPDKPRANAAKAQNHASRLRVLPAASRSYGLIATQSCDTVNEHGNATKNTNARFVGNIINTRFAGKAISYIA